METDEVPDFFTESDQIDWENRVHIQATTIKQHIDHSISSTINLPKDTDPEVVSNLYQLGWKLGLKGITVYVDGSRSGVLVANTDKTKELFPQNAAVKRPTELPCNIHHATIQGEKWIILVGMIDGKPYEVMGGLSNLIEIPSKLVEGTLIKHPRKTMNSVYDLKVGTNGDSVRVRDIVKVLIIQTMRLLLVLFLYRCDMEQIFNMSWNKCKKTEIVTCLVLPSVLQECLKIILLTDQQRVIKSALLVA